MKIATVCSGIGSPEQALRNLGIEHEVVFACEIDKYARQTYLANFQPNHMYQDMTKEEWDLPEQYADLFIGGIPCQAFSLAGKRLGELDKRGLLFYDFYRYVKNQRPKVFIIENVKGLLSDANGRTFHNWCQLLGERTNGVEHMFPHQDSLRYNLYYKVLNSKNFGVPQNRERVFLVGIRRDIEFGFKFPKGWKLNKRLKDVLESNVDEKYYLSNEAISRLTNDGIGHHSTIKNENDIATTLLASDYKIARGMNILSITEATNLQGKEISNTIRHGGRGSFDLKHNWDTVMVEEATKKWFDIAKPGDSINYSNSNTRRGRVGKGIANTLDTGCNQAVIEKSNNLILLGGIKAGKLLEGGTVTDYCQGARIYDINGLSCTISSSGGGLGGKSGLYSTTEDWCKGGLQDHQKLRTDGICPTITSAMGMGGGQTPIVGTNSRIRKLTPLECFRLQDFPDSFIKPVSDTQLYKQSGNSITVAVIQAIEEVLLPIFI
ncbi:DNA (cytosine-5-)-methyltransferase [Pedobacter sp. Hv1]|uniref:DNA (cytosine-5-)-methyltransferase n=1 Tax=Pedobacter sp. Hv1 TaxID=1740090 RepID=UPI0006D89F57|nr:DNA (cytosine-5-)-methyltransferase [Pedobacter sp. Hv1]KQC02067.1 hypothetical protein AQF98_00395 [Pedobacter sp. Hv1]